jgi:metal-responsive CopG/Arc/MetJ family transcriptional regulator
MQAAPAGDEGLAERVIPRYDRGMKTAVSIPDDLFASADELADRLGVSRSELYATAVAEYVAKHRASDVTARLDAVYSSEPSGLDPALRRAQAGSVRRAEW